MRNYGYHCYVPKSFGQEAQRLIGIAEDILRQYEAQGLDLTLRQLYYQFVARDHIPNTQQSYKRLGNIISDARLAGNIPWTAIVDRTRRTLGHAHYDDPPEFVEYLAPSFHTDKWADQEERVEVWVEKEALVGVLRKVCPDLDVTHFACKGYVSQSAMWRAANTIKSHAVESGQKTTILHLGDHDPSGIDMTRDIDDRLRVFECYSIRDNEHFNSGESYWAVRRIALNMDQVEEHRPPPNPAKTTDSRFRNYVREYGTESWELDALEPSMLIDLIQHHTEEIRDQNLWDAAVEKEESQRAELAAVMARYDDIVTLLPRLDAAIQMFDEEGE